MKIILDTEGQLTESLPDCTILPDNKPFFIPDIPGHESPEWTASIGLAFRISRLGKSIAPKFACRYVDAVAACMLPWAEQLGQRRIPLTLFDGACITGAWHSIEDLDITDGISVFNICDNRTLSFNHPLEAAYRTIAGISHYCTLKTGDIIIPDTLPLGFPITAGSDITVGHQLSVWFKAKVR